MCVPSYYRPGGRIVEMAMDQRVTVMCLLGFRRHLRALAIVPIVAMMLVFPASAQSNSDYWIQSTGSAGVLDQSELNRPLTSPDPVTPKAGFNNVLPTAKTKATAARVESKVADPQPESKLGIKKAGSAIHQHRQSQSEDDGFLRRRREIQLASLNRQSRIFNSFGNLYCYLYERNLVQQTMG